MPTLQAQRLRWTRARARRLNGVDQTGTADWVAGRHNPFEVGGSTTVLARLRHPVPPSGVETVAGWSANTSNAAPTWRLIVDTAGRAQAFAAQVSSAEYYIDLGPVDDGAWHTVAAVDATGAVTGYRDGAAAGSASYSHSGGSPTMFRAGCVTYSPGNAQVFSGDLAELAVLGRALSGDEIARWHAGLLDLRAFGQDLVYWDWCGDGPDTPGRGVPHVPGGDGTAWVNMTAADIVEV